MGRLWIAPQFTIKKFLYRASLTNSLDKPCTSSRSGSVPDFGGLKAIELLLRVTSTQNFLTTMNSSLDFSFLETPRTGPITNTTTIIPRQAEPNPRLPAYVDGALAWGGVPIAVTLLLPSACLPPMWSIYHSI